MIEIALPNQTVIKPASLRVWGLPDPDLPKFPTRAEIDTHLGNQIRTGGLSTEWLWQGLERYQLASLRRLIEVAKQNDGLYIKMLGEAFTEQWYRGVLSLPEYTPLARAPEVLQNVTVRLSRLVPLDVQTTLSFEAGIVNAQTIELDLLDSDTLIEVDGRWYRTGTLSYNFAEDGTFSVVLRHKRGEMITRFSCNEGLLDIPQTLLVHPLVEMVVPPNTITSLPFDLRTKTTLERLVVSDNALVTADVSGAFALNELEMTNCGLTTLDLPLANFWKTLIINNNPSLTDAGNWLDRVWSSRNLYANVGTLDIRSTGFVLSGDYVPGATHTDKGKLYSLVNDYGWSVLFDG